MTNRGEWKTKINKKYKWIENENEWKIKTKETWKGTKIIKDKNKWKIMKKRQKWRKHEN